MAKNKRAKSPTSARATQQDRASAAFCFWDGDTLVLNVLGKPSASKDAIGKVKGNQLKVSVTATPEAGRATDHMVRFLAEQFAVSAHDIDVVFGRFTVNKQLRIHAPKTLPSVISDLPRGN